MDSRWSEGTCVYRSSLVIVEQYRFRRLFVSQQTPRAIYRQKCLVFEISTNRYRPLFFGFPTNSLWNTKRMTVRCVHREQRECADGSSTRTEQPIFARRFC